MKKRRKRKAKFKFKKFFLFLLFFALLIFLTVKVLNYSVRNIYIEGNEIYSETEILNISKLNKYPSFLFTPKYQIKNALEKNDLINKVTIKKVFPSTFKLDIEEERGLFIYQEDYYFGNGLILLESELPHSISLPIIVSSIEKELFKKFIKAYESIDQEVIKKISEIKYFPSDLDEERFLFLMADGNYAYVTIINMDNVNYYNKIVTQLEGKKGILYFDSYRDTDAGIITEIIE